MILVLGEILFDELPDGCRPGGAPFNFAQHLHRLGHNVRFVSAIGRDNAGAKLLRLILNAGLDPNFVQLYQHAITGRVAVTVDSGGVPSYEIVKNAAYDFIDFDTLPPMKPEMVYFGSLIQRTTTGRKRLHTYLRTLPPSTVRLYDVNFRDGCDTVDILIPSLEKTDILKLNNEEILIVGKLMRFDQSGDQLAVELMKRFGIREVVLTRGAHGCILYNTSGKTELPPGPLRKEQIVDTVGAGDAFAAMLAHGFLRNDNVLRTLEQCTKLAEYVCTISGAIPSDDIIYNELTCRG